MRPPRHIDLVLPHPRAALLLVDLQEEQRSDPDYASADFAQTAANAARLLAAARSHGWPVAHAQYVRDFRAVPPRPFEIQAVDGAPAFSNPAKGALDLAAEVAPTEGEPVFVKNDASSFDNPGLAGWLAPVDWLILAGVWTEACIAATLRDAMSGGWRVLLVKDACGSGTPLMHQSAVLNLTNRLYGGGICDTDRACTLLQGAAAPVWQLSDPVPLRFDAGTITPLYNAL